MNVWEVIDRAQLVLCIDQEGTPSLRCGVGVEPAEAVAMLYRTADSYAGDVGVRSEQVIALEYLVDTLADALRVTQEYVGPGILPPLPGWSWFDALTEYDLVRGVTRES